MVGIDILRSDGNAFTQFELGLPKMHVDWFDDTVDLARWDHIPAGYIQALKLYDHAAAEAHRRDWPVSDSKGTHLDPTLRPAETARAIAAIARTLGVT